MNAPQIATLVCLLVIANAAPVITSLLLGRRWNRPLDGGLTLLDQRPLLGPSKTIRGVLASVLATTLLAPLLGLAVAAGAGFACLAMLGDACSSFVKRRMGIAPSREVPLLDQLPESLLPLWIMQPLTGGSTAEILTAAALFTLLNLILSALYKPPQAD